MSSVRWESQRPSQIYATCPGCGEACWLRLSENTCPACVREERLAAARRGRRRRAAEAAIPLLVGAFFGATLAGAFVAAEAPLWGAAVFWSGCAALFAAAVIDRWRR